MWTVAGEFMRQRPTDPLRRPRDHDCGGGRINPLVGLVHLRSRMLHCHHSRCARFAMAKKPSQSIYGTAKGARLANAPLEMGVSLAFSETREARVTLPGSRTHA